MGQSDSTTGGILALYMINLYLIPGIPKGFTSLSGMISERKKKGGGGALSAARSSLAKE